MACETGLSSPVKYFTDRSKAVLLLWIIYVIFVLFLLCIRARLFMEAFWSPVRKGLTSRLSFVMYNCEVVTFPFVSLVRCVDSLSLPSFLLCDCYSALWLFLAVPWVGLQCVIVVFLIIHTLFV